MRGRILLALIPLLILAGCSSNSATNADGVSASASPQTAETLLDTSVPADDPALSDFDRVGNSPADVLLACIRAFNRRDWKTAYSLTAPHKQDYASLAEIMNGNATPWDDFAIHETRIVDSNKALVRVTYSKIGFSSLEGVPPEEARNVVVVREPGEWLVLKKHSGIWRVTFKGPWD